MKVIFSRITRILLLLLSFSSGGIQAENHSANLNPETIYYPEHNNTSHYQQDEMEEHNQIKEEMILDEIERISKELDRMEQAGQLSSPIKFAISGILGTIAYGVAHAQIAWLFQPDFYAFPGRYALFNAPSWINAVIRGVIDITIPSLAVGTLLGLANYFPEDLPPLPINELVAPGLIAIISTLGMTTLGAYLLPSHTYFALSMFRIAYITVPINTLALMTAIYVKRTDLHDKKQLELKNRLQEARKALEQKNGVKPAPRSPATLSQA